MKSLKEIAEITTTNQSINEAEEIFFSAMKKHQPGDGLEWALADALGQVFEAGRITGIRQERKK